MDIFFRLGQHYFHRSPDDAARKHYVLHAVQTLGMAFKLAASRRTHSPTAELLQSIARFILEAQQKWDPYQPGTLVVFATFTELLTEQPKPFQDAGDLSVFLDKNRAAVVALSTSYRYGAMELAQATAGLATRLKLDARPWQLLTAEQYEHLATEAAAQKNSAATVFLDHALRLYGNWNEPAAVARVEQQYQQLRTQFSLGTVRTPYPEEGSRAIAASIAADVAHCSEAELITLIAATPMFESVQAIEEDVKIREKLFTDSLPITVQDKHGNAIQLFNTPAGIAHFQLLNSYGLLGQIATQTLVKLMLAAYKADKLTAAGILHHLEASWLGQSRPLHDHGRVYQTYPLRLLASGIRVLFAELDRWRAGETDEPDFVAATDSLSNPSCGL